MNHLDQQKGVLPTICPKAVRGVRYVRPDFPDALQSSTPAFRADKSDVEVPLSGPRSMSQTTAVRQEC